MKFKDVAMHYIGCEVEYKTPNGESVNLLLAGINDKALYISNRHGDFTWLAFSKVKPILRKLEDMTEEDAKEFLSIGEYQRIESIQVDDVSIDFYIDDIPFAVWFDSISPKQFHFLCQRGYDLFGLIDSGEAID